MKFILYTCTLLIVCSASNADEITGKLTFTKKTPFTGVIYAVSKNAKPNEDVIDQKNKQFLKKVVISSTNGSVTFKNSDDLDHNVFANDLSNDIRFDVGLMAPGGKVKLPVDWKNNTIVRVGCKIHPKMRSYVANIPSNHFQILEFEKKKTTYEINIPNVPSDATEITLMIPKYEPLTISLQKGQSKNQDVKRKGKIKAALSLTRN